MTHLEQGKDIFVGYNAYIQNRLTVKDVRVDVIATSQTTDDANHTITRAVNR